MPYVKSATQGHSSLCVFDEDDHALHSSGTQKKRISVAVHGDDFVALGEAEALDWYEDAVKSRFEVGDSCRIGRDAGDPKETKILNQILKLTERDCSSKAIQSTQNSWHGLWDWRIAKGLHPCARNLTRQERLQRTRKHRRRP